MRKTAHIKNLIETVNHRNRFSTCPKDVRQGWNDLLETILHDTKTYEGFQYLTENEVPHGCEPGMTGPPGGRTLHDETRVKYYIHPKLLLDD